MLSHWTVEDTMPIKINLALPVYGAAYKSAEPFDVNSGEVFPSGDMAYRAAAMGQGVAVGDLSVLHEEITRGELVQPFKDMQISDDREAYHLCGRRDCWTDPRIAAFHKWVLDEATWS